jgi:hypothetical protein
VTAVKKKISKRNIPSASAPGALAVTDGTVAVGSIVERDRAFFAFNVDGVLLGTFSTQRMAVIALPRAAL